MTKRLESIALRVGFVGVGLLALSFVVIITGFCVAMMVQAVGIAAGRIEWSTPMIIAPDAPAAVAIAVLFAGMLVTILGFVTYWPLRWWREQR